MMRSRAALVGAMMLAVAACSSDAAGRRDSAAASPRNQASAPPASAAATASRAARAARAAQRCDAGDASLTIDSAGIGPLLLGTRVATLAGRCTVRDTTITLSEGLAERAHIATVAGHVVTALSTGTRDTSIIRVITTDPAFKTAGGIGVGSSVQSLRLAHGTLCVARGEGVFVVMAAQLPGVSFAIDWSPPASLEPSAAETPFPGGDPGTALDAARITRAWAHGVSGGCRVGVG